MYSKKILGVAISILLIAIAGFVYLERTTQPVTIVSKGLWDPKVLNVSYLAETADTIAIGRVRETLPSRWSTPDGKEPRRLEERVFIYTDVILEVQRYLKNPQSTNELVVRTIGGTVGEVTMVAEDEANFEQGEKVLVFLTREDPFTAGVGKEHYAVLGWTHGKFKLTENGQAIREDVSPEHRIIPLQEIERAIGKK